MSRSHKAICCVCGKPTTGPPPPPKRPDLVPVCDSCARRTWGGR